MIGYDLCLYYVSDHIKTCTTLPFLFFYSFIIIIREKVIDTFILLHFLNIKLTALYIDWSIYKWRCPMSAQSVTCTTCVILMTIINVFILE